jgi:hypothetical protein
MEGKVNVIVPQEELDKIEQCRKDLWELARAVNPKETGYGELILVNSMAFELALRRITTTLYRVSNKKYPKYRGE